VALLSLALLGCADKPDRAVQADLHEAEKHMKEARWCEARIALARAEGRLSHGGPKDLIKRVEQMRKDIETILRLDAVRLGRADNKARTNAQYAALFRDHGIDVTKLKPEEAARQMRASAIREELLSALHDWAMLKPAGDDRKALLALADAADENAWRKRLRQAMQAKDGKALTALATDDETVRQAPALLVLLARALRQAGRTEEAIKLLRRAQSHHPADFQLNHILGDLLAQQRTGHEEAVGYYRAALALRPQDPNAHLGLARALLRQGKPDEAMRAFRVAIMLEPARADAHASLGVALAAQGKMDEAIVCFQRAIQLDPQFVPAYIHLGTALQQKGKIAEAEALLRKALALEPRAAEAHARLGGLMAAVGKMAEANACFRKAIELDPQNPAFHLHLGTVLHRSGKVDEAIACFRKALQLDPRFAPAHVNLGHALLGKGQLDEAIACFRKALELQPDLMPAKKALEAALKAKGER
jgi:Tfp pilus assembly protein PilF